MDPDCAICRAPATMSCDCESKSLEVAIRQAESRMMQSVYNEIRHWVRKHAQDYILDYFHILSERRKVAHSQHLEQLRVHASYYYNQPPHPNDIASAQANLKHGIDEDWQASVQRYPEVLEYFFGLVGTTLPEDHDPAVKDPPLSALNGARKPPRQSASVAPESLYERERGGGALSRRTPAPMDPRRTPGPMMPVNPLVAAPPPPPSSRRHAYRPPTVGPYGY
ncbi:hypothetical protein GGR56DRAFT_38969 [Xylariaceae sp. FL0804]|nr:hypothetical protein GGR56DRAFT_38969 [Xylariaceae sp. FL0804]